MEHEGRPIEIKDLNKTQLILLAILLSFVISIATGITTVTLMQQAPTTVTVPINRVVQHTIEKIVPNYVPGKTQTVVVKEDDLVVDAVQKTRGVMFPLFFTKDSKESFTDTYFVGGGSFVAVSWQIEKDGSYSTAIGDTSIDLKARSTSLFGFSILSPIIVDTFPKNIPTLNFGKDADVKPGQTIVVVGSGNISRGLVQGLVSREEKDEAGKVVASWHIITLDKALSLDMIGSVAVNLDGNVVGLVVPRGESGTQILGIDTVATFIAESAKNSN